MQDRVPTPGKENRVRIRLDDGQTIEGVFEYADEASVQGSAYNKANVLPDDVCTALGLPTSIEPKDAFAALNKKGGWTELERITTSKTWTVPDGVTQIGVFLIGGGQSGEASSQYSYTYSVYGGCSGCIKNAVINVTPGQKFNVVIGSGGSKVTVTDLKAEGKPGGDTSFGDIVAKGGGNEVKPLNKAKSFQYGAQMPCDYASSEQAPSGGCNIGFFGGALGTFYIDNDWCLAPINLYPTTGIPAINTLYVVEGCEHPNAAKLLIRFMLGGTDGDLSGYEPFNTLGGWPVRDDIEPTEGSTPYEELNVSAFDPVAIYDNINVVRDFWTLLG